VKILVTATIALGIALAVGMKARDAGMVWVFTVLGLITFNLLWEITRPRFKRRSNQKAGVKHQ